jgi:hypothetical protein
MTPTLEEQKRSARLKLTFGSEPIIGGKNSHLSLGNLMNYGVSLTHPIPQVGRWSFKIVPVHPQHSCSG